MSQLPMSLCVCCVLSRFLAMNKSHLGELRNQTVTELGWCDRKVVSGGGAWLLWGDTG
jgi:hypothetical protein